ncbi:MAG: glycosyltransferase family 2 protein [Erysipelotrichia bacterium]|nr:glycosyltransferase family 2 protein [Erysipelotrichia bacterium]
MDNYKISVIIPVYKVEEYLDRCIESVVGQTYKNLEIILIDDGSPDNCPKMCDDWAKKDNRIRVIHKENEGVSSARNYGIDIATGEYISFVDSDDIIHPKYYEIMLNNIGDADMVYCEYEKFTDEISFDNINEDNFEFEVNQNEKVFSNFSFSFFVVWNKVIKTELLKNIRFSTEFKNAEDTLFAFELLEKCSKVVYIKTQLYGYFIRTTGAVGSIDLEGEIQVLSVWKKIYNYVVLNKYTGIEKQVKHILTYSYIKVFYACEKDNTEVYLKCKKYLKKNMFDLLFRQGLSFKEKTALTINLYFKRCI